MKKDEKSVASLDPSLPGEQCVLPWIHLASLTEGSALPCCASHQKLKTSFREQSVEQVWNSEELREIRKQMRAGIPVSHCRRCAKDEAVGVRSLRIASNRIWLKDMGLEEFQNRMEATGQYGEIGALPISLDLRLENHCNLHCVMCRPAESSKWQILSQQIEKQLPESAFGSELQMRWKTIDRQEAESAAEKLETYVLAEKSQIRELTFGGGEPFLNPRHLRIIEGLVRSGASPLIRLRYHTNGTILPPQILEMWRHFRRIELMISIDGYGELNTYFRPPSDWAAIEENLRKIDAWSGDNLVATIKPSLHFMSFFYIDRLAEWLDEANFKLIGQRKNTLMRPGWVNEPSFLNPQVLPLAAKEKVKVRIKSLAARGCKNIENVMAYLNPLFAEDRSHLLPRAIKYMQVFENAQGAGGRFAMLMPELAEYLLD